jgi:hypothetical protein
VVVLKLNVYDLPFSLVALKSNVKDPPYSPHDPTAVSEAMVQQRV